MKLTTRAVLLVVTAALGGAAPAYAQSGAASEARPELVTDRPDYTESSEVVGRGLFQLEAGFNYEGDSGARAVTTPGVLLRVGLSPRVELRLGTDGYLSQRFGGISVSGAADVEVGVKVKLIDAASRGFDLAVIPMASLPTGSESQSSGAVDPTVKLTWARELPRAFGLTGNVNVASVSDEDGRFFQNAVSVSLGHDLMAAWGGFVEGYVFTPMARGTGSGLTVDAGVTRPIGANLQFDIEAGHGLTSDAPEWFVGFGFAVRGAGFGGRR